MEDVDTKNWKWLLDKNRQSVLPFDQISFYTQRREGTTKILNYGSSTSYLQTFIKQTNQIDRNKVKRRDVVNYNW